MPLRNLAVYYHCVCYAQLYQQNPIHPWHYQEYTHQLFHTKAWHHQCTVSSFCFHLITLPTGIILTGIFTTSGSFILFIPIIQEGLGRDLNSLLCVALLYE